MTKLNYIALASLWNTGFSLMGGIAFGWWMNSIAAGFFAFVAIDAIYDIGIGLRAVSSCDHLKDWP
jgi:hypothetical protein